MSEQDVENTDQVTGGGEVQPDTAEDGTAQDEQQHASSEEQVTEVIDPATHKASEDSDDTGEGESTEETEPAETSEEGSGSGTSDDTLTLSGEDNPSITDDSDESGDFILTPGGDDSTEVTVGDGTRTGDGESSDDVFSFDTDPSDDNVISIDTSGDDGDEDEDSDESVESVEEPDQEPVVVDAGPEDDTTPVEVGSDPPPEDSAEDIVYPEPTPEPDDGPGNDAEGGKFAPVYEAQVDPRLAEIQAQVDLSHLLAEDEEDEEEELQMVFAAPEVERPIVDDQPAPGAGPIPPQPGTNDELDVFEMKTGGDGDGTDPELADLKLAGDADASPPAMVPPDLKVANDADDKDAKLDDLKFGGDADGTDPESKFADERIQEPSDPRLARDLSLRFDVGGDKASDSEDTKQIDFKDTDPFLGDTLTVEPNPALIAHDITSAPELKGSLFPNPDDDDMDDEPDDDMDEDF